MLHYSRAKEQVRAGIQTAETELDRARQDSQEMSTLRRRMEYLAKRGHEIRERNGLEEIMVRVVQQGGTRPHGRSDGGRA